MFSARTLDHVVNPRNTGPLEGGSYGCAGVPGDGPYVEFWTQVAGGVISKATYRTYGCPAAIGSASCLAELVLQRAVEFAMTISDKDLDVMLGGLPEGKGHCAQLAIQALQSSLKGGQNNGLS